MCIQELLIENNGLRKRCNVLERDYLELKQSNDDCSTRLNTAEQLLIERQEKNSASEKIFEHTVATLEEKVVFLQVSLMTANYERTLSLIVLTHL